LSLAKILLVEDEKDIRELIELQLKLNKYDVVSCANGSDAIKLIDSESFDLYILDRMLPEVEGLEICKHIRSLKQISNLPILIITALARPENIVEGLDAGADDYVTKPFDFDVLIARVKSLLRRSSAIQNDEIPKEFSFHNLKINFDKCKVWLGENSIGLTATEYKILCLLIKNKGKVLSRKEMVTNIQGSSVHVTERTIDTHVAGLRKKLKETSKLIETIRGIGYRVLDSE
jgi:two-component system, OmpR family, phosphate regulon response regulator PhoB